MSIFTERPNTALLVVDVQNRVVAAAHERDRVVSVIGSLVDRAREQGTAVIWVRNENEETPRDSEPWQIVPELTPAAGEPLVDKRFGDSFEETDLSDILAESGVGRLVVTGAQTDACVRATLHGAFVRGYDTFLVSDAHTTEDLTQWGNPAPEVVIAHTNLYWQFTEGPGRVAGVVSSQEVDLKG